MLPVAVPPTSAVSAYDAPPGSIDNDSTRFRFRHHLCGVLRADLAHAPSLFQSVIPRRRSTYRKF